MKASGEFARYSWLWAGQGLAWVAINPPPAPPPDEPVSSAGAVEGELVSPTGPEEKAAPEPTAAAAESDAFDLTQRAVPANSVSQPTRKILQIICHDNLNIVSGVMKHYSRVNGMLESTGSSGPLTPFGRGCRVWLNILDQERGRADNVEARVAAVSRAGDHWVFEMEWDRPPSVVLD